MEECNLDTTVCEALLQVGTTSIPPSSTFAPESRTTLFQSNSTSENDIITTSSTSGEAMMNMTDMMKVEVLQIYSNKKVTSDFHGTVFINPVKMSQQIYTKMFIKRRTYKNW